VRTKTPGRVTAAFFGFVLCGLPVRADPVVLTGGSVDTNLSLGLARVDFEGNGFSMRAGVDGFVAPAELACTPCGPGTTVSLGAAFPSSTRAAGSATVDGVRYPQLFFDGMTGDFSTRSFTLSGRSDVNVALPFTFSGTVNGYLEDPFSVGFTSPVFTRHLSGTGVASAKFFFINDSTSGPLFTIGGESLRFDFGRSSPTPEPATWFLVGSGILGVFSRRYIRGR
jgi:PEP-CTERM motif